MTPVRLVFLPRDPDAVPAALILEHGRAVSRGAYALSEPFERGRTILAVPGEAATARWLALPAGRDAQVAQAAAYLLEEELAVPRQRLHVALGPPAAEGERLVVVAESAAMEDWLARAAALGLAPDAIVPDHLLLPAPQEEEPALALPMDQAVAVRGDRLAFTAEDDLVPLVMGEKPYRLVEDGAEIERLLAQGAAALPVDLRQGAFAPPRRGGARPFARAAVLAGLLLASVAAVPLASAARDEIGARQAAARIESLAGPGAGAPVERLRARLASLQAADRFPAAAAAVFAGVQAVEGMELQMLTYGEDGAMRASVRHANYSDVEVLKTQLARAGFTAQETSATPGEGSIVSDLLVKPRS